MFLRIILISLTQGRVKASSGMGVVPSEDSMWITGYNANGFLASPGSSATVAAARAHILQVLVIYSTLLYRNNC